ncbi:uncharacterized protein LOC100122311 isoform X3 [Nasonia vitripennis]|uniref:Uncharacterized protein n=1 Tax=Nasonia vitripennis TaxID=7425 RepID=A0A7M7G7A2_NASVI|nr:uncharacterized protein LOC100122311 isoform X3 [Nasonia vitripennis]
MSDIKINVEEAMYGRHEDAGLDNNHMVDLPTNLSNWHIPRPSLVAKSEKNESENGTWKHHPDSPPSRGSTSSQGSTVSTHSAASGTLLLTAANLANLAAIHPPRIGALGPKQMDTASVASSTHFTVVNGLGRPSNNCQKSWCARNQLTVLVCTMSFLFMLGLLAGVLYIEMRARGRYN